MLFWQVRKVRFMNHRFLIENQKKRRDFPLWMLVFFSMFSFWQMGFIFYFLEPSSALDGKIPIDINIDYGTLLTAACYILGILTMIFLPKIIVWVQRIAFSTTPGPLTPTLITQSLSPTP